MTRFLLLALALVVAACAGDTASDPPAAAEPGPPEATTGEIPAPGAAPHGASSPGASSPDADSTTYVLVLGNSLTAGYGLANPDADAYPALLQTRIDEAGIDARVVNAGVSGDTSAGGRRRIDWVLRRQPVDVLVLALGGNDGLRGLPPDSMQANLSAIIGSVRAQNEEAAIVVAGMEAPPNMGDAYTGAFRQVFRDLAAEHSAALVPFLLDGVGGIPAMNQPDGIHPTEAGQERLAANVWPALEEVLR
ncbi:MAG: arylesterase [Bacteroidota bacterium]